MSANLQKIQTALEACRIALGKVVCVKSVAWSPDEATIDLQPGHERELTLIDEALVTLDELEHTMADVMHEEDGVAGESTRPTGAA